MVFNFYEKFAKLHCYEILLPEALRPEGLEIIQSRPRPRGQTYVFKTKNAQGIQKWVQNNQWSALPSTYDTTIFQKTIFGPKKSSKKLDVLLIFEF